MFGSGRGVVDMEVRKRGVVEVKLRFWTTMGRLGGVGSSTVEEEGN